MKFRHVMLRVADLDRSIQFYRTMFGLNVLRQSDYPSGQFTLAFLGFEDESSETVIELTHNWGDHTYELGTGFGHLAFEVDNVYATCEDIRSKGGVIRREPGPMKHGTTILAFVSDPDGYQIELIQTKERS